MPRKKHARGKDKEPATTTMTFELTKAHLLLAEVALETYQRLRKKAFLLADRLALAPHVKRELDHARVYATGAAEVILKAKEEMITRKRKTTPVEFHNAQARGLFIALELHEEEVKKTIQKQHAVGVEKAVDSEAMLALISELRGELDEQLSLFPSLRVVREPKPEALAEGGAEAPKDDERQLKLVNGEDTDGDGLDGLDDA